MIQSAVSVKIAVLVGECDDYGNVDESATSELIRTVSTLAGKLMAEIHRNGFRADAINYCSAGHTAENKGSFEASASARGVWNYTVGLVGKPSAGKSTFYNEADWMKLMRLLKYLNGSKEYHINIKFTKPYRVKVWVDASFGMMMEKAIQVFL